MKALEACATAATAAFVVMHALRPAVAYPHWATVPFEHPWIFVLLLPPVAWLAPRAPRLAALLGLALAGPLVDMALIEETKKTKSGGTPTRAVWASGVPSSAVPIGAAAYPRDGVLMAAA